MLYRGDDLPTGYAVIPVLHFLSGQPLDDLAMGFIHALQPSRIRVTTGEIKCDACDRRVTIYVTDQNIIRGLEIEAHVALRGPYLCGDDLNQELFRRGVEPVYWDESGHADGRFWLTKSS